MPEEKDLKKLFLQDSNDEEKFIDKLPTDTAGKITNELEVLIVIYNEQVDQFCRNRIDTEVFRVLEVVDPTAITTDPMGRTSNWSDKRKNADKLLRDRRVTLKIAREHILNKIASSK